MNTASPLVLAALLAAGLADLSTMPASATDRNWTGANSANWSDPNNWSPAGTPQDGDGLYFGISTINDSHRQMFNDLVNLSVNSLYFVNNDYQIDGNALTASLILSGVEVNLDSYTTTINCPLIFPVGGQIQTGFGYGNFTETTIDTHLNGPITVNSHKLLLWAASSDMSAGGNGHLYVSGAISGNGDVSASGDDQGGHVSNVEFNGTPGNTFSGTLYLYGTGNSQIVFNKSSGAVVTNRLQVNSQFYSSPNSVNLNLSGPNQIDPNATIAVVGGGQLSFSGNNVTVGNLQLANSNNAAETNASILDTGSITVGLNGGIISSNDNGSVIPVIRGNLNLNGVLPFIIGGSSYAGLDMQAAMASAGGIAKSGNSALLLETSNTFSGGVTVYEGSIDVRDNYALGASSHNYLSGGSMTLRNVSIIQQILYAEGQSIAGDLPGSLLTCVGSCSWAGPIVLDTNLDLVGDITISGQVFGTAGLGFFGTGTSVLTGAYTNYYTGTTLVRCPLLELDKPAWFTAVPGPLVVGGGSVVSCEARWLNAYQNSYLNGAALTLFANGLVNLNNFDEAFGPVTFNGGHFATGTGTCSTYQPLTVIPSDSTAIFDGNLYLAASPTAYFNIGDGPADPDLLMNATISGGPTLFKQGSGTMRLTSPNTYTGVTLVNDGVLQADDPNALGDVGQGTVVNAGATLRFDGLETIAEPLNISGTGMGGTQGALEVVNNGDAATLTAPLQLNGPSTINLGGGAGMTINSVISGTGPLTLAGSGTLSLGGGGNNTYSGDTIVSGGALFLSKGPNVISVPGNLVIGPAPAGPQAIARFFQFGGMGGTVATVNANSIFDLNGYGQVITQLNLNDGGSVVTGTGMLDLAAGAVVSVGSLSPSGSHVGSSISGNIALPDGATTTFHINPYAVFPPFATGPELDVPAVISGTTSQFANYLAKDGLGQMRLSGNNAFPEPVVINGGPLIAANSSALGTGVGGVFVNNDGDLVLDGGISIPNTSLHLNSSNSPALDSRTGSIWSGLLTLSQGAAINVLTNGYLQLLNSISGPGGLTKLGPGTLQFWGSASNSYGGSTTVAQGTLDAARVGVTSIPGDTVIGDDTNTTTIASLRCLREQQIKPSANVSVHSSGYLYLYDYPSFPPPNQRLRTLTGSGQVRIDSQALLTISNDVPFTFDGVLNGGGGANVTFLKTGPETMTLSSKSSASFFGSATLSAGTLRVDGYFPSMAMEVKAGGLLRGGGTLNTAIIENSATLGADSPTPDHQGGSFQVSTVQLTNGSTLQLNFFGPAPSGGDDQMNTLFPTTISNATLAASFFYPPREGDVLTLLHNGFGGAVKGTFNGWLPGQQRPLGTVPVVISYTGNGVNDVTLTVTNLALAFSGYRLAQGNGNQTVEPDECNLLYVALLNRRAGPITITNAVLRAMSSNTLVTIPQANYPLIAAGLTDENTTPFQFRTDPALPCGSGASFELVLSTSTEGQFAIDLTVAGGSDCTHPTGPCQSCSVVSGLFTPITPVMAQPLYFVGAPSICYPPKACPGVDPATNLLPVPYITHFFTNSTTTELCLTAQLQFNCPSAPTNALGLAAYLGSFDPTEPCAGYLGDLGQGGPPYPPFSFRVPAGSNFALVVMQRTTNLPCNSYAIELFGLPCPLPTLAISPEATPNTVRVQWSTAYPGWTAQQVAPLGGAFSNVLQQPVIVAGRYSITNIPTTTNHFYRLKE